MLASLLLSWLLSQVPCVPSEGTVACQCKQGIASACEVLAESNPELLKKIAQGLAMAKAARESKKANVSVDTGCGQPPDDHDKKECTGQEHHLISKAVWTALEEQKNLRGKFKHRDPRFVTRAVDKEAHCGWQDWHRQLDEEIAAWIRKQQELTLERLLTYLREVYARPELKARFPNGF